MLLIHFDNQTDSERDNQTDSERFLLGTNLRLKKRKFTARVNKWKINAPLMID